MLKSCQYCGRIHLTGAICKDKPVIRWGPRADTRSRRFRSSYAWQMKSAEIRERDHYVCKVCIGQRQLSYQETEVHHIEPLNERYDLRLDDDNLINLCKYHHRAADSGMLDRRTLHEMAKNEIPPLLL